MYRIQPNSDEELLAQGGKLLAQEVCRLTGLSQTSAMTAGFLAPLSEDLSAAIALSMPACGCLYTTVWRQHELSTRRTEAKGKAIRPLRI